MGWIRILYKSGHVVDFESPGGFTAKRDGEGHLIETVHNEKCVPRPLWIGINEIESIWDYGDQNPKPSFDPTLT